MRRDRRRSLQYPERELVFDCWPLYFHKVRFSSFAVHVPMLTARLRYVQTDKVRRKPGRFIYDIGSCDLSRSNRKVTR